MENQSLANRTFVVEQDKYKTTVEFLKEIPTVIDVIWICQTSSTGNWSGAVVEKVNKKYQVCEFSQSTDYECGSGRTIEFGNVIIQSDEPLDSNEVLEILENDYYNDYYDSQEYEIKEEKKETLKKPKYEQQQIDFG